MNGDNYEYNNNDTIDWEILKDGISSDDETFVIQSLLELCNHLCILTEDNLKGFDSYQFLPKLVSLIQESNNPDILVYSCRSILHITEIFSYYTPIENHKVVEAYCERLQSIEYIDFAELMVQNLVILSDYRNLAIRIIKSGGLTPLLMYLDFFSNDIQLKSIETVSNTLKFINLDLCSSVESIIHSLSSLLTHHNVKIIEHACIGLYYISKAFRSFKKDMNILSESSILRKLNDLLLIHSTPPNHELSILIHSINTIQIFLNDQKCFMDLMDINLPYSIYHILNFEKEGTINMDSRHLYQIALLLNDILPDFPINNNEKDHRYSFYNENPKKLQELMNYFIEHLITISEKTTSNPLITKCLSVIRKMILLSSKDILIDVFADISFSQFVSRIFGSNNPNFISITIDISNDIMEKLPDIYGDVFLREGVVFELNQFINSEDHDENTKENNKSSFKKKKDVINKENIDSENQTSCIIVEPQENRSSIIKKAIDFKNKYFNKTFKPTKALDLLNKALNNLEKVNKDSFNKDEVGKIFVQIVDSLQLGLSTYEMIESKLIDKLYQFLLYDIMNNKDKIKSISEKIEIFVQTFSKNNALKTFLNELHNCIDKIENFQLENLESQENIIIRNIRYLNKQFRIKCKCKDDTENRYLDIYMGPLSSVKQLKELIQIKLQYNEYYYPPEDEKNDNFYYEDEKDLYDDYDSPSEYIDINQYIDDVYDLFKINTSEYEQNSSHDINLTDSSSSISKVFLSSTPSDDKSNETTKEKKQRINLYFQDNEINDDLNLFQMVHLINKISTKDSSPLNYSRFWSKNYEIVYTATSIDENNDIKENETLVDSESDDFTCHYENFFLNPIIHFTRTYNNEFKQKNNTVNHALNLIKLIYALYYFNFTKNLSKELFFNKKLTTKITQFVKDPLSTCTHSIPSWIPILIEQNKHLFSYDTRLQFFKSTSLGVSRSLLSIKENLDEIAKNKLGRLHRKKIRIHHDKILQSFIAITRIMKNSSSVLEIEYFDEVATGLGPTLEFFTLLSKEYRRKDLNLWVNSCNDKSNPFIYSKNGLFPLPMTKTNSKERELALNLYKSFGYFIARSIYDSRLIDIFLSRPLVCLLLGESVNIHILKDIFPDVLNVIESLNIIIEEKRKIQSDNNLTDEDKRNKIKKLTYNNVSIEDLSLYFVLPGYDIEIIENGSEKLVTIDNLELYVEKIVQFLLKYGIEDQVKAIREGFNNVFDISTLKLFYPDEINTIIAGSLDQQWDKHVILENIKCDHGYTINSPVVQYIVEIMSEFNDEERRKCLQFLTGSPCLPYNGFKGFNPKLTIVRKEAEPPLKADDYLPSVNTCFLYLKLPEYSSKEIAREKFVQAIENGQTGFSLS